ncbi:ubiquinone/menaquinone biosynthesis methyltransferase [Vulcanimicrobium alpinum]|uniref:Ubiquinone/menaquinone biosynthesis methyltransferase n=1 Tax=Vulcanimicrobium alpinum TaxID=3016050 RepID=A0AAN2CBG5_UNVUL|nr:methyltransferase domain-containing protein [Vulcanimicrobium alpinum]BDE07993.1 ubiquinone/menaquinone biosynthesis methyltransferase [Vulcanimicrobium alpinum]
MQQTDAVFSGSIAEMYDRYLGALLFEPYAEDLAERLRDHDGSAVLETAAGTGIVTRALARALKTASIVASDLNPGMIERAAAASNAPNVRWEQVDAGALPFGDRTFGLVVCQFGVMFFPEKVAAFREAARVLAPGGRFAFNVWDDLGANPVPRVVHETVAAAFPQDPPQFIARTPHGFADTAAIATWLRDAGFHDITVDAVEKRSRAASARAIAIGFVQGTPVRSEIEERDAGRLAELTDAVEAALIERFGNGAVDATMRANVFIVRT